MMFSKVQSYLKKQIFFVEFPSGCHQYKGHNRVACYVSIWNTVGCLKEGYNFPRNLTRRQKAAFHQLNLEYVYFFL